jgi:mandelate racemase
MKDSALEIRALRATAVQVPMRHVLGTSQAVVRAAPLMLVDVETEAGITGHAYLFCYVPSAARGIAAILEDIERRVKGERVMPAESWGRLARGFTLIGVQGIVRMAMSGFDVACWDVLAQAAGVPLATLLGAAPRPIRAYNSCGLGLMGPEKLRREADELLEGGFRAVKLRLGYATLAEDLAAVKAVRERLPAGVELMVDYNQALGVDEAIARGRALDAEGIAWIEEPIRHDDYRGCARVAQALSTPVQIGENFSQVHAMAEALDAGACDLVMPDLERIGGVTGWQQAASLAAARDVPMSSHLFPEVSAQLLSATPTAHWLEYVDWAAPLLERPLAIVDGFAQPGTAPGNGLAWNRDAVRAHRMA